MEGLNIKVDSVGRQVIYCHDCLELMRRVSSESVDIVITSPPYNIGVKYREHNDNLEDNEYLDWMHKVGQQIKRILVDDGSFFINLGSTNVKPFIATDLANVFRNYFVLQNHFIWVKSLSVSDKAEDSHGHFKPIRSDRYVNNTFENIFHFTKSGRVPLRRLEVGVPYKWKSNTKHRKTGALKPDKRCRGNVWFIPYETIQDKGEKYHHPATFPIELPKMCIRLHGVDRDPVVCDPFVGIGTTLVAAEQLGLRGMGFEKDPTYYRDALRRLRSLTSH